MTGRVDITRENIARGTIRDLARARGKNDGELLTDAEMLASRRSLIPDNPKGDIWVFGYGSLIWNPQLEHAERRRARIHGYHRRFCLKTGIGRGTPENPGLVLGLDRGGSCEGMGFRIERKIATRELDLLWQREMFGKAYSPRIVKMRLEGGTTVDAVTFVIDRKGERYAGDMTMKKKAAMIATASGFVGPCAEYLERTHESLQSLGINDIYIGRMLKLVRAENTGKIGG